jgi:hypothetical protein
MVATLSSQLQSQGDTGGAGGISSSTTVPHRRARDSIGGTTMITPQSSTSASNTGMSMCDIDGSQYVGVNIQPTQRVGGTTSSTIGVSPAESSLHLYTQQMTDPDDSGWRMLALKSATKAPRVNQFGNNVGVWMRQMVSWLRLIHDAHLELGMGDDPLKPVSIRSDSVNHESHGVTDSNSHSQSMGSSVQSHRSVKAITLRSRFVYLALSTGVTGLQTAMNIVMTAEDGNAESAWRRLCQYYHSDSSARMVSLSSEWESLRMGAQESMIDFSNRVLQLTMELTAIGYGMNEKAKITHFARVIHETALPSIQRQPIFQAETLQEAVQIATQLSQQCLPLVSRRKRKLVIM